MPFSEALLRVIIKKIRNLPLLEPSMFFLWKRVVGISERKEETDENGSKETLLETSIPKKGSSAQLRKNQPYKNDQQRFEKTP
jgi:hypothetical protein